MKVTTAGAMSFIVVVLVSISSISHAAQEKRWMEEVRLDDGSVIQVRRSVGYTETNSVGGSTYNILENDARLAFTGLLSALPEWRAPFRAVTLYFDKTAKEWAVVATTTRCDWWRKNGKPNPPYWEYRLDSKGWRQVPLSKTSVGRPRNLLSRYQRRLPEGIVTLTAKDKLDFEADPLEQVLYAERVQRVIVGTPAASFCG